jgi:hypothetical protein
MPETIRSGVGNGYQAKVNADNRLHVYSKSASNQHSVSEEHQEAYQVIGTATLAAATVPVLHIKNTSSDKNMIVSYIRHQVIDPANGTALPNASCYFKIALGRTYTSGGSEVTPVNVYGGSAKTAEVTAYDSAPTLGGTAQEIDRWYTKAEADMNAFNKEGALIIPPNKTIELSYVGDHTAGICYARVSFYMEEQGVE